MVTGLALVELDDVEVDKADVVVDRLQLVLGNKLQLELPNIKRHLLCVIVFSSSFTTPPLQPLRPLEVMFSSAQVSS